MLVSIVIPAYNAERSVAATLRSVLSQTHGDLEVIVIDDGSIDRTADIASATGDERVTVLTWPNHGVSAARDRGSALARGQAIAFLDADDLWDPTKLEVQLTALDRPDVAAVGCKMRYVAAESGKTFGTCGQATDGKQHDIASGWFMPFPISSALFQAHIVRAVGGFDHSLSQAEDLDFMARVAQVGRVELVGQILGSYRVHGSSVTATGHVEQQVSTKFVQARLAARAEGRDEPAWDQFRSTYRPTSRDQRRDRGARYFRRGGLAAVNGDYPKALRDFAMSFALRPVYSARRLALRLR